LKISDLHKNELAKSLRSGDFLLSAFPFVIRIRSDVPQLSHDIAQMYGDFHCLPTDQFADFHIEITLGQAWERWIKPTAYFHFDGLPLFVPLPAYQAFTMLEWGLNWCVAAYSHQYLIFHAAVIEKNGQAVILPAPPGSGKSTLCAALVNRGWRLLSDELALYDLDSGQVFGMARPVNLKNESIDVIKSFEPTVQMTKAVPNTTKGNVALMRPSSESVLRAKESANPAWVITPKFQIGASASLERKSSAETFMLMAEQSFNYEMHGIKGFQGLGNLIDRCECYQFSYSNLEDAILVFEELAEQKEPR
jgi:HprK-related kinase A